MTVLIVLFTYSDTFFVFISVSIQWRCRSWNVFVILKRMTRAINSLVYQFNNVCRELFISNLSMRVNGIINL